MSRSRSARQRPDQESSEVVTLKPKSNSLRIRLDDLKTFSPLTENQKLFFDAYNRGDYFMALLGSAGSGKTFCSLAKALEEVMDKGNSFDHVLIVRSAVQTRDSGFLPGDLDEKMALFEDPYHQICYDLFNKADAYQRLKEQGVIRFISTTALRGCSFDNAVIIVDECQSMSYHELCTVITRTGNQSKIIFVGDTKQNDLIKKSTDVSGLPHFVDIAKTMECFTMITFTPDDICRSSLVKDWIIAVEKFEENQ